MPPIVTRALIALLLLGAFAAPPAQAQSKAILKSADGVAVSALKWPASGAAKATILLFHMAGSNKAEYAPIAPRLAALGYDVTAIDQRSGGSAFGASNETARAFGKEASFAAALPDLEAALADARAAAPGRPVIVWGSSYSAALVFVLAAKHKGEVAGILAFSPGEYLSGTGVRAAAAAVDVPVFVSSASDAGEIAAAKAILAASPAKLKIQYEPKSGVHGSSTLRADSNPGGAAENWAAVVAFLVKAVK